MGVLFGLFLTVVPSCGAGSCNANTCGGCCTSAGKCVTKPGSASDTTCGAQAKACVDCTQTGQTCSSMTYACTAAAGDGGSSVGAACTDDSQCGLALTATDQSYSIRGFCKKASLTDPSLSPGFTYPGGSCTKRCGFENASCGPGSACIFNLGFIGDFENQCVKSCTSASECRAGYGCVNLGTNLSVCLPLTEDGGALPLADAGPGVAAEAGAACTTNAQCIPPSTGFCFRESLSDGGPSGFTGGECSADCSALAAFTRADEWCGHGGVCNAYGFSSNDDLGPVVVWQCDRGCGPGWDAGCRSGYVCDETSTATPACVPDCHHAGVQCPTGTTCQGAGICQ